MNTTTDHANGHDSPSAFTLRAAAGLSTTSPPLEESTIVVIDAQQEYAASGALALPNVASALERIAALLATARANGSPIIHIAHQGPAGGLFDPSAGGKILAASAPAESELVIRKSLPNAFAGTDLHEHLTALGHRPLVLAGFMTHMCIGSTARAALDLGFDTTVLSDATATRALPDPNGGADLPASEIHRITLAALADRFAVISTTAEILATSHA